MPHRSTGEEVCCKKVSGLLSKLHFSKILDNEEKGKYNFSRRDKPENIFHFLQAPVCEDLHGGKIEDQASL